MTKTKACSFLLTIALLFILSTSWAAANQPLVIGYVPDNFPYSSVDSKGYAHGFCIALAQLICKEMNITCVYDAMSATEMFAALQKNKIDIATGGITITAEREKVFNFTIPILPDRASFIGFKTEGVLPLTQITSKDLENSTIAVRQGSFYPSLLRKKYPDIKIIEYSRIDEMIAALVDHKADFAIMDTPAAYYWINQTNNKLYIAGSPIFVNTYIGMMLNKNNLQLLNQLNAAILLVTPTAEFKTLVETFFGDLETKGTDLL